MKKIVFTLAAVHLIGSPTLKASPEVDSLFAADSQVTAQVSEEISKHKRNLQKLRTLMVDLEASIRGEQTSLGEVSQAVLGGSFIGQTYRLSQNIKLGNIDAVQKGLAGLSLTRLLIAILAANTGDEAKMREYYDAIFSAKVQIQILIKNSNNDNEVTALKGLITSIDELEASIATTDRSAIADMGTLFIWTDVLGGMLFKNKLLFEKILQTGAGALVMANFIQALQKDSKESIVQKISEIKNVIDVQLKTLN